MSITASSLSRSSPCLFALPGMLPEDTRLLFDQDARIVVLLSCKGSDVVSSCASFHLAPSAARLFFSLLHASPAHCSYEELFQALFPLAPQEEHEQILLLRPIRRALAMLLPVVRALGLQVIALRGRGYLLTAATP